jgi:signal transduction histidine kinase
LESEKEGEVIREQVKDIKENIAYFKNQIPELYNDIDIPEKDKEWLVEKTSKTLDSINENIRTVEQANKQLSSRVKIMEKVVGAENRLYDMLHAIKNRLAALEAMVTHIDMVANKNHINFDKKFADKVIKDISNLVTVAMRRSSPKRKKRDTIILTEFISEFIEENKIIYPDVEIIFNGNNYFRIFVDVEELRISLENLLDNSVKAMKDEKEKKVLITTIKDDKNIKLYYEDNGCGISKDNAPFIFNVSFTTTNGSGIGLPNVLDFMKSEGGDINLMESGRLKGASFELVFPLKGGMI